MKKFTYLILGVFVFFVCFTVGFVVTNLIYSHKNKLDTPTCITDGSCVLLSEEQTIARDIKPEVAKIKCEITLADDAKAIVYFLNEEDLKPTLH